jgi:cytochrome c oxidase subunit 1
MIPAILLAASFFMPGGAPATGWTPAPLTLLQRVLNGFQHFAAFVNVDHGFHQYHRHDSQHARSRHDLDEKCRCSAGLWLITAYLLIVVMLVLAGAITIEAARTKNAHKDTDNFLVTV